MAPSRGGGSNPKRMPAPKRGQGAHQENRKARPQGKRRDRDDDAEAKDAILRLSLSEDQSSPQISTGLQQSILDVYSAALDHLLDPDANSFTAGNAYSRNNETSPEEPSTTSSSETAQPSNQPHQLPSDASSPPRFPPLNPPPPVAETLQRIKQALYNRDFQTVFFNSDPAILQAYAARWSPSRTLGYLDIFHRILPETCWRLRGFPYDEWESKSECGVEPRVSDVNKKEGNEDENGVKLVALGGGAGGEVVALAGLWDVLFGSLWSKLLQQRPRAGVGNYTGMAQSSTTANSANGILWSSSDSDAKHSDDEQNEHHTGLHPRTTKSPPCFHITALDIADWSSVLDTLTQHATSSLNIPVNALTYSFHQTDLLSPDSTFGSQPADSPTTGSPNKDDISPAPTSLSIIDETMSEANIITLAFTLNELYAVSIAKTQAFLLRLTKQVKREGVLVVVDSPGTYSTVGLGRRGEDSKTKKYPMAWLLDHALLKVAPGVLSAPDDANADNCTGTSGQRGLKPLWKKRKDLSSESQWFRLPKDDSCRTTRLSYPLQLENMRYQVHVFERV